MEQRDFKFCFTCNKKFYRKYFIRIGQWLKTKYCSRQCAGIAKRNKFLYFCDFCGKKTEEKPSHYQKSKRHFCSINCYSNYRKEYLPKEEQPRFGSGFNKQEKQKRIKARSFLNHAIRDKRIERKPCEICGNKKSEAHHEDYDKPLKVKWLCFKHHRKAHNQLVNNK